MNKNQQASVKSRAKTSKHPQKPIKRSSKELREAAKIVGSLGGRPRKDGISY